MAAPTNVACEATSITSTAIYWDYTGANSIGVYRATPNDSSYSLVTTVGSAVKTYADTGLAVATKYWYKLSDDAGSTFSTAVSVYTQTCAGSDGDPSLNAMALPRAGDSVGTDDFNLLAQQVEQIFGDRILKPGQCPVCVSSGQVVVDCTGGCTDFVVFATEDINSISINRCDHTPFNIEFIIPPNTTRKICGWPGGFGFGGDECRKNPFVTGARGGSISTGSSGGGALASPASTSGKNNYGGGAGGGGGGGSGSGCTCVPTPDGLLTIKVCNPNNSLNCSTTKSLELKACGGRGPYTWSRTGSVGMKATGSQATPGATATGTGITVTPATNTGSGTAGNAYEKQGQYCDAGSGLLTALPKANTYGCNDQVTITSTCSGAASICGAIGTVLFANGVHANCTSYPIGSTPTYCQQQDGVCDVRTAPMIAAGCVPCGISAGSSTVSVTDANGVTVTIVLAP